MAAPRKPFPTSRGGQFGTVEQVFDDTWWAWGTTRFAPGATFPRNMLIFREGDGLVVVHPVMLPEQQQARVDALGPVRHIVRLGDFHGMDDALYVERYGCRVWAPPGCTVREGAEAAHELVPGGPLPLAGATLLRFERCPVPETVLVLERHGGILVACDAVQNWETRPAGCSFLGGVLALVMGFGGRACLGPGLRKQFEPKDGQGFGPDFRRLLELDFKHLLASHGPPVMDTARDDLRAVVARTYPQADPG